MQLDGGEPHALHYEVEGLALDADGCPARADHVGAPADTLNVTLVTAHKPNV